MSRIRKLVTIMLVVASLVSGSFLTSTNVAAAPSKTEAKLWEMVDCALIVWLNCFDVEDAAKWSERVTAWKFPGKAHNNKGDAFRHCAWMGALATRVGPYDAIRVGEIHEKHHPGPDAERLMDLANNEIGAWIGSQAAWIGEADTWGYVMDHCERLANDGLLAGLDGIPGNWID